MNKPILCFYLGYNADHTSDKPIFGSELALKKLSEQLVNHYRIYMFSPIIGKKLVNNITFYHSDYLNEFMQKNEVDIMVINRYVHYFLEFTHRAKKLFYWLHDQRANFFWQGSQIPNCAKYLVENVQHKIDKFILISNYHLQDFSEFYDIDQNRLEIIPNGIDFVKMDTTKKIKNRFIYVSDESRGLLQLVNHFIDIKRYLKDAELYIYRKVSDQNLLRIIKTHPFIKLKGYKTNQEILKKMAKCDFWYYPTNFYETYCISALEAQLMGCMCITSNLGGLIDTVGDRGILLKEPVWSDKYWEEALDNILELCENDKLKQSYTDRAKEWAASQTWENISKKWIELFTQ